MKQLIFCLLFLIAPITHAFSNCPQAKPTTDYEFCASFASVASCHCTEAGLPAGVCQDMNIIYNRMIKLFGSIERACQYQRDTDTQTCIDDWKCYLKGGKNSHEGLCSSTGKACVA